MGAYNRAVALSVRIGFDRVQKLSRTRLARPIGRRAGASAVVLILAVALAGCPVPLPALASEDEAPAHPEGPVAAEPTPDRSPTPAPEIDRAALLLLRGDSKEAEAIYASVLAEHPSDAAAMAGRVRALIALDTWNEAVDAARAYLEIAPGSQEVATAYAEALFRAARIEEAGRVLEPLVEGPAPPARALVGLGRVRSAEGRLDEASALVDRALALAPDDRTVVYFAAELARTRAESTSRFERYLELSEGDDADRIEGARQTVRTNTALGERPVWVAEASPERMELPLRAIGDRGSGVLGYVVEARIGDGKKIALLLDTGSGGLFVVERAVHKAGLEPLSEATVYASGEEERHAARRGILPAIAFGGLSFRDALVTVTPSDLDPYGRFHGVLGLSVFVGWRVTIDLDRGRLVLAGGGAAPAGSEPFWSVAGQFLVEAGVPEGARGLFLLDTGAAASLVAASFAGSVPGATLGPPAALRGYGGRIPDTRVVRGLPLAVSGLPPHADPKIAGDLTLRSRMGGVEISGLIGLDLLDGQIIEIDTVGRRVKIARPTRR